MKKIITSYLAIILIAHTISCATKKGIVAQKSNIPSGSRIAVIVNHPNNIKNVILAKFIHNNYIVKAFNATDLYSLQDVFDVKDFKRVAQVKSTEKEFFPIEKAIENLYKLHVYNYELNKAESLMEMRNKYNLQYLILMELKDWQKISWARAIDLANMEVIWVENYPAKYKDTLESVIDHFIASMSGKK